jgi:hypothetical protein
MVELVEEMNLNDCCNCGKPVRYTHLNNGEVVGSCNKHRVCPTYEELLEQINKLLIYRDIARTLAVYREDTDVYRKALSHLKAVEGVA